jgi:enoyl-[acyl-carrier protein] reductase II
MESLQNPARVLKSPWTDKILELESRNAPLEELAPLISGQISRAGWVDGNLEEGIFPAGQVVGRIKDIPSVAELMERIVSEASEVMKKLDGLF